MRLSTSTKTMRLGEILLNRREVQVLHYLIRGMTIKEIAAKIYLHYRTVEHHSAKLKEKFGCNRKSQLIGKALDVGFPVRGTL